MYVALSFVYILFISIIFNVKNVLNFIIYTELFWMFIFFLFISSSSFFDDSRFFTLAFIFLFIATLEILSFGLCLLMKIK